MFYTQINSEPMLLALHRKAALSNVLKAARSGNEIGIYTKDASGAFVKDEESHRLLDLRLGKTSPEKTQQFNHEYHNSAMELSQLLKDSAKLQTPGDLEKVQRSLEELHAKIIEMLQTAEMAKDAQFS